jgi:hypothetical protein
MYNDGAGAARGPDTVSVVLSLRVLIVNDHLISHEIQETLTVLLGWYT